MGSRSGWLLITPFMTTHLKIEHGITYVPRNLEPLDYALMQRQSVWHLCTRFPCEPRLWNVFTIGKATDAPLCYLAAILGADSLTDDHSNHGSIAGRRYAALRYEATPERLAFFRSKL